MGSASSVIIITLIVTTIIIVTVGAILYTQPSGCRSNSDCLNTQVCQDGRCLLKAGQVCVLDSECASGLVCRNNVCTTNTTNVTSTPPPKIDTPTGPTGTIYVLPPMTASTTTTTVTIGPRPRQAPVEYMDYEDDEMNSCGSHEDAPFAVISGVSSNEGTDKIVIEELTRLHGALIIDACTYSNYNVFLLRDGALVVEEIGCQGETRPIRSLVILQRIIAYQGTLFGLSAGVMYRLKLETFSTSVWQWEKVKVFPTGIIDISLTTDGEYLWIQTSTEGFLFHGSELIDRLTYSSVERRIYGTNRYHYLEIDRELCQGKMYPQRTPITNVCYGQITAEGNWVTVGLDQQRKYERIVMLNWRPYFLRRF